LHDLLLLLLFPSVSCNLRVYELSSELLYNGTDDEPRRIVQWSLLCGVLTSKWLQFTVWSITDLVVYSFSWMDNFYYLCHLHDCSAFSTAKPIDSTLVSKSAGKNLPAQKSLFDSDSSDDDLFSNRSQTRKPPSVRKKGSFFPFMCMLCVCQHLESHFQCILLLKQVKKFSIEPNAGCW